MVSISPFTRFPSHNQYSTGVSTGDGWMTLSTGVQQKQHTHTYTLHIHHEASTRDDGVMRVNRSNQARPKRRFSVSESSAPGDGEMIKI
ncbi:hypothetical protein QTP88_002300 [Uroleucon formosanum]